MLTALLLIGGCGGDKDKKPPKPTPEAGFVVVRTQRVPLYTELAGRTAAYETSEVRPQVAGIIKERNFTEGTIVRAGQTLYQIDPSLYRAAAQQAQANVANAEAIRVGAEARAVRYKPLAAIQAVSAQDFTDAQATARQAAAGVALNRAALETARINLRFTRVPAPITGRIGRSLYTTGALVTASQTEPLTTIQRLDPIFVDVQQSSAALLALRRSLSHGGVAPASADVTLTLEDGSAYERTGRIQFAEAMVDQNTGTVTLRATFPNPQGLLLPGMYVRARLSQATAREAMLVPEQGVSHDPTGAATVMLIGAGDKVVLRRVAANRTIGAFWLVTGGLKPGDRVITEGLSRVKPGQVVKPVAAGSPRTPPAPKKKGDSSAAERG